MSGGDSAQGCRFNNGVPLYVTGAAVYVDIAQDCFFENHLYNEAMVGTAINCHFIQNEIGLSGTATGCTFENSDMNGTATGSIFENGGIVQGTAENCTFINSIASRSTTNNSFFWLGTLFESTTNSCWFSDPLFVDAANGNYRLQTNSPCIDAGDNQLVTSSTDKDGNPRISNRRVVIGAYESLAIDQDSDGIPNWWELRFFGSSTSCNPTEDSDEDHQNNFNEFIAGTDPTNSLEYFCINECSASISNLIVSWDTVTNRIYSIYWTDSLTNDFSIITNIRYPKSVYTNEIHDTEESGFCKLSVQIDE